MKLVFILKRLAVHYRVPNEEKDMCRVFTSYLIFADTQWRRDGFHFAQWAKCFAEVTQTFTVPSTQKSWHYVLPSSWGWGWGFQIQLDYQAHVPFMTPGELGLRTGNLIYHGLNTGESEHLNNLPLTLECSGLCLLSLMPSPTHPFIMPTPHFCSSALGHCPVACDQSHSTESSRRQALCISPRVKVSTPQVYLQGCPLEDSVCLPGKLHTNVHRILMCSAHCLLHYSPILWD